MKDLNHQMNYGSVMTNFWPTVSENNTELIEEYAPMTSIMINMKDIVDILNLNGAKSDSWNDTMEFHNQIKCTDSLLDMDSYWLLQKSRTQRMMISLPCETYYQLQQSKTSDKCFNGLKNRVPYLDKIFDYECIDLVIFGNDHFS